MKILLSMIFTLVLTGNTLASSAILTKVQEQKITKTITTNTFDVSFDLKNCKENGEYSSILTCEYDSFELFEEGFSSYHLNEVTKSFMNEGSCDFELNENVRYSNSSRLTNVISLAVYSKNRREKCTLEGARKLLSKATKGPIKFDVISEKID